MRILALETSTRDASVAALEDGQLLGQTAFPSGQRTAQVFAPLIAAQLEAVGWRAHDVHLFVVSQGPGSFTGLRVGITAAKTLAYATGAEVLGVNTLQVIASQTQGDQPQVEAVIDAQRQQLFVARFRREPAGLVPLGAPRIVDNERWLASLAVADSGPRLAGEPPGGAPPRPIASGPPLSLEVTGPGLARLRSRLPAGVVVAPPERWPPEAAAVGRVGYAAYLAGCRDDLWKLVPHYYRQSAAEEKAAAEPVAGRDRP